MTHGRIAALGGVLTLVLVLLPAAPAGASGGGGCGQPVTTDSGTEITIDANCFSPAVLFADVGDTVTWKNFDPQPHNVAGAHMAWGSYETFHRKKTVSYSFAAPGVYSYVCTMHPGMVGTVVVGDPQPGGVMDMNGVERIKTLSATQPKADPVQSGGGSNAAALWLAAGTVAAFGGALAVGRVRRRPHASETAD